MADRAALINERLHRRLEAVCTAVPPVEPGSQYWLVGGMGDVYCHDCAMVARGREFELGPLLHFVKWYDWPLRVEWQQLFLDGIEGGMDCQGDNTEACDMCGKTLSYILTDEGVSSEIGYYLEGPLSEVRDEDSYALDRLALNVWEGSPRPILLGVAAIVNQAWRLVANRANPSA